MGKKCKSGSKRGAGLAKWQKKQPKKARAAETAEPPQQILVQPAPTTTTAQPTPIISAAQSAQQQLKQKQRGGRKQGDKDVKQRKSRAFNCDGAEMQTPLPKKRARSKSVEFLSPSFCASKLHGAEERDPKRSHQDYFRNGMATSERKEGLTKRLENMTSELGTRDAHFLQRLGQLHINSVNTHEKEITELADEMKAMDLVAEQLDQQADEIDVLNQQLQLARSALEKTGCVCVAFLLCFVPHASPPSLSSPLRICWQKMHKMQMLIWTSS